MVPRFVTCFDSSYLAQGVTMLESLFRHCPQAQVHVLDLEGSVASILESEFAAQVNVVTLDALFAFEPRLVEIRGRRLAWEFYSTLRPSLLLMLLSQDPHATALCYVDADMYFFADPSSALFNLGSASVALSPHRFSSATQHLGVYGPFNAGLMVLRNDTVGVSVLHRWQEQCIDWCHRQVDASGRFMNQGYLASWPIEFEGVSVIGHPGVNLAPWNVGSHRIGFLQEAVLVDDLALVCFHFSSLWRHRTDGWCTYRMDPAQSQDVVLLGIYGTYLRELEACIQRLTSRWGPSAIGNAPVRSTASDDSVLVLSARSATDMHTAS